MLLRALERCSASHERVEDHRIVREGDPAEFVHEVHGLFRHVPPHDGLPQTEQIGCSEPLVGVWGAFMACSLRFADPKRSERGP